MTQPRDEEGKFGETHGTRAANFPERYSDGRTVSGKRLQGILDAIVSDLGGHESLSAGDRVTLDLLRGKLMVVLRLSDYLDAQPDVVREDGNLLSILSRDYLRYLESTDKSIATLYHNWKGTKPPLTLDEYMAARKKLETDE